MEAMSQNYDEAHRLGRHELGPYAYEDRMPDRIRHMLQNDGQTNVVRDILPKLERLLRSSSDVDVACLCCANAVLIHRLAREGNTFCGYRNIQMLLHACGKSPTSEFHTVLDIQESIEQAWDNGHNPQGRIQTGGIRGSRKYIGTSEAEALFEDMHIACTGTVFRGSSACKDLFKYLEAYFGLDKGQSVHLTDKMPVFLQRPRHSLLVVGIGRFVGGSRMLLVLDPGTPPSLDARGRWNSKMLQKIFRKIELATYCKSERTMSKYVAFETLSID